MSPKCAFYCPGPFWFFPSLADFGNAPSHSEVFSGPELHMRRCEDPPGLMDFFSVSSYKFIHGQIIHQLLYL